MIIKTKKYIASFIVLSYIVLSIANITHYHYISINTNLSKNISEFPKVQKGFNHSISLCPIQTNFNNLHNLTISQIAYSNIFFLQAQNISLIKTHFYPSYLTYHSISLRAPPELHS